MITIYKNKIDIPENMKLVEFNDIFFNKTTANVLDEKAAEIIENIDGARLQGKYKIESCFNGTVLDIDKLSSGCKTVLNIVYFPNHVFSIKECGDNALDFIYSLQSGNIFSEYSMISFDMDRVLVKVKNEEIVINDYEELKEWWERE